MKNLVIICFPLLLFQNSIAQIGKNKEYKDYLPYEVGTKVAGKVYLEGDTIQGLILIQNPYVMQEKVKLFSFNQEKIGTFKPADILGYEYGGGSSIVKYRMLNSEDVSKIFEFKLEKGIFILELETGRVNLYKYINANLPTSAGGIPNGGGSAPIGYYNSAKGDYILETSPHYFIYLSNLDWKEKLAVCMQEFPELSARLKEKSLREYDIPELIMEFNKLYAEKHGGNSPLNPNIDTTGEEIQE